VYLCTANIG